MVRTLQNNPHNTVFLSYKSQIFKHQDKATPNKTVWCFVLHERMQLWDAHNNIGDVQSTQAPNGIKKDLYKDCQ